MASLDSLLETQPWKRLCAEGKTFLVKGIFANNSYSILVTDLGTMWEENINEQQLLERSKELNPYIEVPSDIIIQQLSQRLLQATSSYTISCSSSDSQLILSINGPLKDVQEYQWKFVLARTPSLTFKYQLVNPLLSMTVELLRQQKELMKTIAKKDKEIKDYKENGATISRKHLETLPFDELAFKNEMILTEGFKFSSTCSLENFDIPEWQKLYKDISLCNIDNKDCTIDRTSTVNSQSAATISISPRKRPLDKIDSKNMEETRRKELKKQLEDSMTKNKKKKKKLM